MSHSCHYSMINKRGPIRGVPRVKKTNSAKDGVKLMRLSEDEVKGEEDEGQDHPYQHPQQNQYYQHHHHQQSPPIFHHTHYSAHRSDETLVALALAAEHSAAMALEPEPVVGLESYHVSARGFSSDRPPESDLQAMIARFSRKVILQLVDLYFEQVANHQFSFVHKTSLVRGVHDGTADPMLVASICAICCKFSTLPLIQRDDDSSETFGALARQLVERQLDEPTLSSVQALLVLAMYEKGRGSNPRSWTYGGMAFRLVTFLELHRERPRISQISPSDWLTHETARRLYWTSYMLDRLSASGTARPHVFQEANSQLIPLPSSELQFQSVVPVDATILLEPAEIEDPGFMALVTRLTSIWGRITDYLSEGINYPTERSQGQLFQGLKNELYAWERRLGPMMRYNQHTLLCAVNAGEGGIFAYMHLLYDHCWSVLLRAYLIHHRHHINSDMIRTVCLEHAMHISQLITDAVKYPFLLNTPYSGYCIFLSSMILVTELADEENTQERELRRALAVNVNLLVQQKQYWSGAGYFVSFSYLPHAWLIISAAFFNAAMPVSLPLNPLNLLQWAHLENGNSSSKIKSAIARTAPLPVLLATVRSI